MYYPPLFTSVKTFDPRSNQVDQVPVVGRENPLDLSVKTIRPTSESGVAEDLMMLDHRKLANLAAAHSLSGMGRQLLDPTLFRLGYGTDAAAAAAMLPGLTPPFCYDRATGVAVPTSLAGHPIMTNYLQQRERLEQQHQQAMYAARTNAVAQQQAAVAAAAVAYMDPANLPLHLRNGLTQREAAAALAATRGLYAPTLPAPMVLPAFSLYTDDKGAFTSLRNSSRDNATEKSFLNGTSVASTPVLDAARYAEHFHRLRDLHQHQPSGKCNNACCTTNSLTGLGQTSVPCACCVPSQAALCARSPMGCTTKDPTAAATGKVCDYVQPSLSFLHRPTATTVATTTSSSNSSEIRLSVSSLCSTQTTTEPTTVSSSRDKHQSSSFRPTTIWNPTVTSTPTTSSSSKTAFTVPKKKDNFSKDHQKEHKASGSIKDILKDNHHNTATSTSFESIKYDSFTKVNNIPPKSESSKRNHEKSNIVYMNEDFSSRYPREASDVNSYVFHRGTAVIPPKSTTSNIIFSNSNTITTTVASVSTVVPPKIEVGTVPVSKMPPLLEAVRPSEPKMTMDVPQDTPATIPSPQGPPPLIAVSNTTDHLSSVTSHRSLYPVNDGALRMPTSMYPSNSLLMTPYKHSVEKSVSETSPTVKISPPSKSPKKSNSSQQYPKFNGLSSNFVSEEPPSVPLTLPKPIPQLPTHHLTPTTAAHPFSSHYRPAQHQLNLQNHNGWIPAANPNVTVAPLPQPVVTTTTVTTTSSSPVVTTSHQSVKTQQPNFTPIKREPDYADTANVLQSLLIRPAPGLEPLATLPPSTVGGIATSVVTPTNSLPLFGLDYRYPFPHQLLLNRDGLPSAPLNCVPSSQISGSTVSSIQRDIKPEITKTDNVSYSQSTTPLFPKNSSKKRPSIPNSTEEVIPAKKRLLTTDFTPIHNQARYSFQPNTFANEVAEANECPYTFIPEPPLNFSGQFKSEDGQKSVRKDVIVERPLDVPEVSHVPPKSPVTVPVKSSPQPDPACVPQLPAPNQIGDRLKAIRARRRLRKRLLARIYQQRRPLFNGTVVQPDPSVIDRQLAVRYTRKLLSQLTLRWAHRRYVHKWHSMKRKNLTKILKLKRKRKDGKVVYRIKKETNKESKKMILQEEPISKINDAIPIPAEMKKLMVNKALGETTLHRAARLGYPEAVAYCLKTKCVSVNARDNAGYTPLHECCSRGHLDIARALLQYGADVNASAAGGIRPLHDAVENDHVEIVRLLLSYGADPTIATYSGLEPIKLARSPMMAEFLQGFFADISGEVDSRPHLPWRFWGSAKCLDPEDCGYDVFDGVPSDPHFEGEADNDFLFEVSDSPHLPTFRLLLPAANTKAQCNYLRLNDVLRKLCMTKEDFLMTYSYIEVLTLPSHEFEASAMCSPLLTGTKMEAPGTFRPCTERIMENGSFTDLVRLDNSIRQVLGIETISVR